MTEIMAPAGSYAALMAAIKAGCDSVYFGIQQLNMRARSSANFTLEDLERIVRICKTNSIKSYLAINTILYDNDLPLMRSICDKAKEVGVTAVIVADIAAMKYARSVGLEVHSSTQLNISNIEEVKFFAQFTDVIVLARELTLQQIKGIIRQIKEKDIRGPSGRLIEIEVFIHGALCVSISGKCYMSLATRNCSANRGACLQTCRAKYRIIDEDSGTELVIDNNYVMSPRDLCTIRFIDKLINAGISVFKIEGRGRSPDYVYKVVRAYREAVEAVEKGTYSEDKVKKWEAELKTVFNRGFWHGGYYLGKKLGEWAGAYGSQATERKELVGVAEHYFSKKQVGQFLLKSGELKVGDKLIITGPTTGVVVSKVKSMLVNDKKREKANKGDVITVPIAEKVRKNDKLYVVKDAKDRALQG